MSSNGSSARGRGGLSARCKYRIEPEEDEASAASSSGPLAPAPAEARLSRKSSENEMASLSSESDKGSLPVSVEGAGRSRRPSSDSVEVTSLNSESDKGSLPVSVEGSFIVAERSRRPSYDSVEGAGRSRRPSREVVEGAGRSKRPSREVVEGAGRSRRPSREVSFGGIDGSPISSPSLMRRSRGSPAPLDEGIAEQEALPVSGSAPTPSPAEAGRKASDNEVTSLSSESDKAAAAEEARAAKEEARRKAEDEAKAAQAAADKAAAEKKGALPGSVEGSREVSFASNTGSPSRMRRLQPIEGGSTTSWPVVRSGDIVQTPEAPGHSTARRPPPPRRPRRRGVEAGSPPPPPPAPEPQSPTPPSRRGSRRSSTSSVASDSVVSESQTSTGRRRWTRDASRPHRPRRSAPSAPRPPRSARARSRKGSLTRLLGRRRVSPEEKLDDGAIAQAAMAAAVESGYEPTRQERKSVIFASRRSSEGSREDEGIATQLEALLNSRSALRNSLVVDPDRPWIKWWSLLQVGCALYTYVVVAWRVAFRSGGELMPQPAMRFGAPCVLDWVADALLLLHVLLRLVLGYTDASNNKVRPRRPGPLFPAAATACPAPPAAAQVLDSHKIVRKYVGSRTFTVHVLCLLLPLDLLQLWAGSWVPASRLNKLLRIFELRGLLKQPLDAFRVRVHFQRLLWQLVMVMLFSHTIACLYFSFGSIIDGFGATSWRAAARAATRRDEPCEPTAPAHRQVAPRLAAQRERRHPVPRRRLLVPWADDGAGRRRGARLEPRVDLHAPRHAPRHRHLRHDHRCRAPPRLRRPSALTVRC